MTVADAYARAREYVPLVKKIAVHVRSKLPPGVDIDDIIQAGMIGLLAALENYEETNGARFETYAGRRIHGAMIDELRSADWVSRNARIDLRNIARASSAVEQRLCRKPSEGEIAADMGIPLAEFQKRAAAAGCKISKFEDLFGSDSECEDFLDRYAVDGFADPLAQLIEAEDQERFAAAIATLSEREKTILRLSCDDDLTLREIGEIIGIGESRVCQVRTTAIEKLQAILLDGAQ